MFGFRPALPGFGAQENFASWPVWGNSTPKPVRFDKLTRKEATTRYRMARHFDLVTKKGDGCHGGEIGPTGLKVLESLTKDFLNYATGQLDPGYKAIAKAANISVSAVHTALKRLRELGIVAWVRRCDEGWEGGRYVRRQKTNAYSIRPVSEWHGFMPPREAPPPLSGTWGDPERVPDVIDAAIAAGKAYGPAAQQQALRLGLYGSPKDDRAGLLAALACLGARVAETGRK